MKSLGILAVVLGALLAGCAYEDVEVHLQPSYSNAPALIAVNPPQMAQQVKIVELDGVRLGGGGGLSAVKVGPGRHRLLVRIARGNGYGSAAKFDHVSVNVDVTAGGRFYLEVSQRSRMLVIRDAQSGRFVGESRYRML